jgi:hypothetical protein
MSGVGGYVAVMRIDKHRVLELLRSKGDDAKVEQAARELPDELDTDEHGHLLSGFGLEPQEIVSKLGGGPLGRLTGR